MRNVSPTPSLSLTPTPSLKPSIAVLFPNGGNQPGGAEEFVVGNSYNITWKADGFEKAIISIIDYSCSSELFLPIATNVLVSQGTFSWNIPSSFFDTHSVCHNSSNQIGWKSGDNFKIFVAELKTNGGYGVQDESDSYFSIREATPPTPTSTPTPSNVPCGSLGDVNNDGKIGIADSISILQHIAGTRTFNEDQKKQADVNGDGQINNADSALIQDFIVKKITTFPACNPLPALPCGNIGDVNNDGKIDILDSQLILKYIVGNTTLTDFSDQKKRANVSGDTNADGSEKITTVDSILIQRYMNKEITAFPACPK